MVTLARFTPSLLGHEILEQLFVAREPLLAHVQARIERATQGDERSHTLWVGPRGAGKTHLLSLVYHRARRLPGWGTTFQLAWLPEDPWAVDSLDDLYGEVLEHLEPALLDEERSGRPEDELVGAARRRGPIVVLVENLDQVFEAIGAEGQRRLRALLENHRPLLLVATATKLTEHLVSQAEPFYGFFDTTTLEPFGVDQAAAMLKAIARLDDDQALVHRLDQPGARARLAAIEHLAGGQPRVWALLGSGLTIDALGELVAVLLERFDDLTPYYQEQLARLSPHERKVVRTLAAADRSMTVRDLAAATGIGQQSLAKTITELRRSGWVRPRTGLLSGMVDRRLRYYELAEPLVRLAFQLKSARGEPVRLVLDFLTAWFDREQLAGPSGSSQVETYLQAALDASVHEPSVALCLDLSEAAHVRRSVVIDQTTGLYAPVVLDDNPAMARLLAGLDDALAAFVKGNAVPLLEQPPGLSRLVEHRLASTSGARLRLDLSDLALRQVVDDPLAWVARAEDALTEAEDHELPGSLALLARWHLRAGQRAAAETLVRRLVDVVQREPTSDALTSALAGAEDLIRAGEIELAGDLVRAIEPLAPAEQQVAIGYAVQVMAIRSGRPADVAAQWERVVRRVTGAFGPDHLDTLISRSNLANSYLNSGRVDEAIALGEELVADSERLLGAEHPSTLAIRGNLARSYHSAGRVSEAIALGERLAADSERVLGPDHPVMLAIRGNLASAYRSAGRVDEAIAILEKVIADLDRLLGPDHPGMLVIRGNLAIAYRVAGRVDEAIAILEQVIADHDWVFGPDHPQRSVLVEALESWKQAN